METSEYKEGINTLEQVQLRTTRGVGAHNKERLRELGFFNMEKTGTNLLEQCGEDRDGLFSLCAVPRAGIRGNRYNLEDGNFKSI